MGSAAPLNPTLPLADVIAVGTALPTNLNPLRPQEDVTPDLEPGEAAAWVNALEDRLCPKQQPLRIECPPKAQAHLGTHRRVHLSLARRRYRTGGPAASRTQTETVAAKRPPAISSQVRRTGRTASAMTLEITLQSGSHSSARVAQLFPPGAAEQLIERLPAALYRRRWRI
jgi:hypothetical protein